VGAKGAIWCGTPVARVRQLAIYTFPDLADLSGFWPDRLSRIEPEPVHTDTACEDGVAGVRPWANGDIACYLQDGVAKVRWTDLRTGLYGLMDATDSDLQQLYSWWRSNGRRLGRDTTTGGGSATPGPRPTIPPATDEPGRGTSFVCEAQAPLIDPLDRRWKISQVSFRRGGGIERVIYHLQRDGTAAPAETSVMVDPMPIDDPNLEADTGVDRPSAGDTALSVYFGPGIRDATGLKHYTPRGVETVKDLSIYRLPSGYSLSSVGVIGEGCYQLRVPAFDDPESGTQTIEVYLDIQP